MLLAILDDHLSAQADQSKSVDLTQFKAGDRLEARIVQIASSGRTILQFAGFRAVVDRLAGGREGDVMQFEVLPDEKPARGLETRRPPMALSNKSDAMRGQKDGQPISKVVRLNALPGAGASRANAKQTSLLTPKPVSQAPPFTLSTVTPASLPGQSLEIVSTWFRRILKNHQLSWRAGETRSPTINKPELMRGLSQAKTGERPGMLESERLDRPRESNTIAGYNALHLGDCPVKMKIFGRPPGKRTATHRISLTAVFFLNLEHTGAVRADIHMVENRIKADFFVESEACRAKFAEALPGLTAALSPLAKHCKCNVAVSPLKINDFLEEEGGYPENGRFDIRA